MPSWHDGSSPSPSILGDLTDLDYAPETIEDSTFSGLAVNCGVVCRRHNLDPIRCVAFDGTNTGRRFYLCSVENEVNNCGFVSWYDEEWPETLQTALARLWSMYEESNQIRIDERLQNAKLVEDLVEEKKKLQKNYTSLLDDVKQFMTDSEKRVMEKNLACMLAENAVKVGTNTTQLEAELVELKMQRTKLQEEVCMLKQIQATQAEVLKAQKKTFDEEKEAMKQKTKKLEYMLYDLLKARDEEREAMKDKVKRIKTICDE